jgi:tetratricopeptide (TPR) repeat protein
MKYLLVLFSVLIGIGLFTSCEKLLDPEQELQITDDKLFDDWYEYRAIEMGLYGLQQQLVEQLVILGELRGDLLSITPNADPDMVEIYNFNVSKTNKYASPTNFFKLISASNNFIRVLVKEHPEILNPDAPVTNFDRLYGEALCMRAWAYFNAVRIYGKVPYIHESLVTMEEIDNYIKSPGSYVDSVYIVYGKNGYHNDTIYNHPITLERKYYDTEKVVDVFAEQLEKQVKAVGVNHYIDNNDNSWEVTIWNTYAYYALLGQMYLTRGDLAKAVKYFREIMNNTSDNRRYQLDESFANFKWNTIFNNIDNRENIFTLWFNKENFQQNNFQSIFETFAPHKFMLKPSSVSIFKW